MSNVLSLPEFRCTRRLPYIGCECPGKKNLSARQGYYIRAETQDMAIMQMLEHFPEDRNFGFDVQVWQIPKGMDAEQYNEMFAIMA